MAKSVDVPSELPSDSESRDVSCKFQYREVINFKFLFLRNLASGRVKADSMEYM